MVTLGRWRTERLRRSERALDGGGILGCGMFTLDQYPKLSEIDVIRDGDVV